MRPKPMTESRLATIEQNAKAVLAYALTLDGPQRELELIAEVRRLRATEAMYNDASLRARLLGAPRTASAVVRRASLLATLVIGVGMMGCESPTDPKPVHNVRIVDECALQAAQAPRPVKWVF